MISSSPPSWWAGGRLGAAHPFEQGFTTAIGACLSSKSRREYQDREQVHEEGEPDQFPEGAPGAFALAGRPFREGHQGMKKARAPQRGGLGNLSSCAPKRGARDSSAEGGR